MQIEDEVFHAFLLEAFQGIEEFFGGGGTETVDADVTRVGLYHVRGVKAQDGYLVALHREVERIGHATAHDGQVDFRVLGSAKPAHDVFGAHLHSGDGGVVDGRDAVAGQYACFFRRAATDGLDDEQGVFYHLELHADAFEIAL